VLVAWAIHAGLDWTWEMPAVTLQALLLGGAAVAWSERPHAEMEAPAVERPELGHEDGRTRVRRPVKA
jgi:hypothetical protein